MILSFYSDLVIQELKKLGYSQGQISQMLDVAKPYHLKKILFNKQQISEARKISREKGLSKADVLHAILSRDNHLQLITQDSDFDRLRHITKSKLPEDFL